ncbi:MAG TPA: hypothetical protein VE029_04235 [Rhizobacter sp.]|nr:hypothetical protein [Rhizobacter sp.]
MWKQMVAVAGCLLSRAVCCGPALTEAETRWLDAGWPVIAYAKQQKLPLDIVVQPQPTRGNAPIAMGFVGGRCKLVLSMRGNPAADASLADVPEALQQAVIEATVAHEIGHCWRYVQGAWHTVPSGFVDAVALNDDKNFADDEDLARQVRDMRETRREEGFADLVGLAWTQTHHPSQYAPVYAWLAHLRNEQPVAGGHHDTGAWVRLAADGAAFGTADTPPFDQALPLWQRGLLSQD